MAAVQSQAMPAFQDFTVELTCGMLGAWTMVTQMAALRVLIQKLTDSSSLPAVVMHAPDQQRQSQVSITALSPGGSGQEVICSANSIEEVKTEFTKRFQNYSTIKFTTDNDRLGLLSEVTDLLKVNGLNIVYAEISTDAAKQHATHVYGIEDAATGECVPEKTLARLEAGFASLQRTKSAPLPMVLQSQKPARDPSTLGDLEYLVRLACPGGNVWEHVAELDPLRMSIQQLTCSASLPPVEIQVDASKPRIEVVSFPRDSAQKQQVVCSGVTAKAVQSTFSDMIGRGSTVTFRTNNDRPGLLAEVTGLLKLHGANIMHAEVSTDAASRRAIHIYKIEDAVTGRRLSNGLLAKVESDLKNLGEVAAK
mmetsp:Transcript_80962/g.142798  ORF Transcript_80962/g.142798 Transcript_80962/m.142798 type:complete len:366 (-) Transcript_80962:170-1267(-)|eukprot:CAMPEP_0197638580 /NCGR_PEP_ID=MMETSP1338-20131121/13468_1 /TAXON_ID=43686 ORGANISM="Pelagodinium beii, Strain RCC1491" /NCGR_SAMPLE_ID=MMETSP1338 /ASSEMBLY_ACC=CAM_ASM_000754 /LENGTH=365 /DNA_ID=CAMNT_0043211179 /DNA_START=58 /DNA_END=1155 /DNA_ORIENTATION=+